MAGLWREVKLLLVFFLRIALFAGLFGLGGFDAAFVVAFFAGFFGLVAAALGARAQWGGEQREGAGNHREHFNALHIGPISVVCLARHRWRFRRTPCATGRLAAQIVPVMPGKLAHSVQFVNS